MLNILSHQRNANQKTAEIPSYTCKNDQDQKHWWQLMLERLWDKVNSPVLLVGVQAGTAPLDVSVVISQKIRNQPSSRPKNTTYGYIFKGCSIVPQGHVLNYVYISIVCHSQTWKQSKCPSTNECIRKMWYVYTMDHYTAEKKWHPEICRQMYGAKNHHFEWGNPDPERQLPYVLTH